MFECLDRNNDKELSLDEFSHALKRRNLEKLFPRRAASVLALMGRVDGVFMRPRRLDGVDAAVRESVRLVREPREPPRHRAGTSND